MPELPDDSPLLDEFTKELMAILSTFVNEELTLNTMFRIDAVINDQSIKFKQNYGYDIPKLTAIVLPTSRQIAMFRADLPTEQIHIVIMNLLREYAVLGVPVDMQEFSTAIKQAWPHYDPAMETFAADGQAGKAFIH